MAGVIIQPRSAADYPSEASVRRNLEDVRAISNGHAPGCACAYCATAASLSFMLRGPHPVIHRENCGDCFHGRAGV